MSDIVVTDSNGNELKDGDNAIVIKTLKVKGLSFDVKKGMKVKGLRLTDNPDEVDCKVNGTKLVLRTEFLKKA